MMRSKTLLLPIFFIILFSCSKRECLDAFQVKYFKVGEVYCLNDFQNIMIDSIADSRCPSKVECVWAGNVIIHLTMDDKGKLRDTTLTMENNGMSAFYQDVFGFNYKIVAVDPYPIDVVIPQDQYQVELEVSK